MAKDEAAKERFRLLSPEEVEALPDLDWLIDGVLPKPSFAVLYGEPGCGKTFVALSMALQIANGQPWLERGVRQGRVLYLAAEGVLGLKLRIAAHRERFGVTADKTRFLAETMNVTDVKDSEALVARLKEQEFMPDLIVIDTFARVTVGMDENSAQDMGRVVDQIEYLRNVTGATILMVHHSAKNSPTERGSGALRGAVDVMIRCAQAEEGGERDIELICAKMKDAEPFQPIAGYLDAVCLGKIGQKSLVLIEGAASFESAKKMKNKEGRDEALARCVRENFAESGATHAEAKEAFTKGGYGSKSTFNRAWRALPENKGVREVKVDGRPRWFPVVSGVTSVSGGDTEMG